MSSTLIGACVLAAQLFVLVCTDAERTQEPYLRNLPEGHGAHCYVGRGLYAMQLKHWLRSRIFW